MMPGPGRSSFSPGTGTAIANGRGVALIDAPPHAGVVLAIGAGLREGASLASIMTALSREGFEQLPAFALVVLDDGVARLLLRGGVSISVRGGADADRRYQSAHVATWREEVDPSLEVATLALGDVAGEASFWFTEGFVPAGRVVWHHGESTPSLPMASMGGAWSHIPDLADPASSDVVPGARGTAEADESNVSAGEEPRERPTAVAPSSDPASEAADLDFANLVDKTVYRHAEDAAVRARESHDAEPGIPAPLAPPQVVPLVAQPGVVTPSFDGATVQPERTEWSLIASVPGSSGPSTPTAEGHLAQGPPHDDDPDHDGFTVVRRSSVSAPPPAQPSAANGPGVQAVICPVGHANPPTAHLCRVCDSPISDRSVVRVSRPTIGVLHFSTGQTIDVIGPIKVGRVPPAGGLVGGQPVQTVAIEDPELSRLHVVVHVSEWFVHVEDQDSTNGTVLRHPGKPPQTLRPYERAQLLPDTVVDLGGSVTFRYSTK